MIPHPKNSDKDVVVFLDDDHAAPSQEEAAQRAAVAALNRVAGERALERVLPREYVPLWQALTQQVCGPGVTEERMCWYWKLAPMQRPQPVTC